MSRSTKRPRVIATRTADPDHVVQTIIGGQCHQYRREPCPTCPWRTDAVGIFPAEAFRHAANVSYDVAQNMFACHESGKKAPATCAGFLLRNAQHNLAVRLKVIRDLIDYGQMRDGGHELFASYRAMAVANGVDPSDPVLAPCRADDE